MPWNLDTIIPSVISSGLVSASLTIYLNWRIEKKRSLRANRKEKLASWRQELSANKLNPISKRDIYHQIKEYLTPDTIKAVEGYTDADWSANDFAKFQSMKDQVLNDLNKQERKWELV